MSNSRSRANNSKSKAGSQPAKTTSASGSKSASRRVEEASSSDDEEEKNTMNVDEIDEDDDPEEAAALAKQYSDEEEGEEEDDSEASAESAEGVKAEAPKKIDKRTIKKGPRAVHYTCSALVQNIGFDDAKNELKKGESGLVQAEIFVTMPPKAKDFFDTKKAREEAIKIFTDRYGVAPIRVGVPSYSYLGAEKKPSTPRDSIKVDNLAEFTGKKGSAIHYVKSIPWNVTLQYTENPEEVFVMYNTPAVPLEKKMQKPTPRGLRLSALSDIGPYVKPEKKSDKKASEKAA